MSYRNDPRDFLVSISGLNLFKDMPPMEIRKYTFLIGPNGSGKSTFLRLLPLFALPSEIRISEIVGKGYSLGHFPKDGRFTVTVEYDMPVDHWESPSRSLVQSLESYASHLQREEQSARGRYPELDDLLAYIDRSAYDDGSAKGGTTGSSDTVRVRVSWTYGIFGDRLVSGYDNDLRSIAVEIDGTWHTIFGDGQLHCQWLRRFELFQKVSPIIGGVPIGQISRDLLPQRSDFQEHLDVCSNPGTPSLALGALLDCAFAECTSLPLSQVRHAAVGWGLLGWIEDFFSKPIERRFSRIETIHPSEVDSGPVFPLDNTRFPFLPSAKPDKHANDSVFLPYWLNRLGVGERIVVDFLDQDGWRLRVKTAGGWKNVVDFGSGIARLLWLLYALDSVRRQPLQDKLKNLVWRKEVREDGARARTSENSPEINDDAGISLELTEFNMRLAAEPKSTDFGRYNGLPAILQVEEPESRLHPRYQSFLADLLTNVWAVTNSTAEGLRDRFYETIGELESFAAAEEVELLRTYLDLPFFGETPSNQTVVVETHSEYLIRRLQSLVASSRIDPGEIAIHYFSTPGVTVNGEAQWSIFINGDGTLTRDFGPGFFGEAANLIDELWEAWKPKS